MNRFKVRDRVTLTDKCVCWNVPISAIGSTAEVKAIIGDLLYEVTLDVPVSGYKDWYVDEAGIEFQAEECEQKQTKWENAMKVWKFVPTGFDRGTTLRKVPEREVVLLNTLNHKDYRFWWIEEEDKSKSVYCMDIVNNTISLESPAFLESTVAATTQLVAVLGEV